MAAGAVSYPTTHTLTRGATATNVADGDVDTECISCAHDQRTEDNISAGKLSQDVVSNASRCCMVHSVHSTNMINNSNTIRSSNANDGESSTLDPCPVEVRPVKTCLSSCRVEAPHAGTDLCALGQVLNKIGLMLQPRLMGRLGGVPSTWKVESQNWDEEDNR